MTPKTLEKGEALMKLEPFNSKVPATGMILAFE